MSTYSLYGQYVDMAASYLLFIYLTIITAGSIRLLIKQPKIRKTFFMKSWILSIAAIWVCGLCTFLVVGADVYPRRNPWCQVGEKLSLATFFIAKTTVYIFLLVRGQLLFGGTFLDDKHRYFYEFMYGLVIFLSVSVTGIVVYFAEAFPLRPGREFRHQTCGMEIHIGVFSALLVFDFFLKFFVLVQFSGRMWKLNKHSEHMDIVSQQAMVYTTSKITILNFVSLLSTIIFIPLGGLANVLATGAMIDLSIGSTSIFLVNRWNNTLFDNMCCLCMSIRPHHWKAISTLRSNRQTIKEHPHGEIVYAASLRSNNFDDPTYIKRINQRVVSKLSQHTLPSEKSKSDVLVHSQESKNNILFLEDEDRTHLGQNPSMDVSPMASELDLSCEHGLSAARSSGITSRTPKSSKRNTNTLTHTIVASTSEMTSIPSVPLGRQLSDDDLDEDLPDGSDATPVPIN